MQASFQRISPFLWFDTQAEEAAQQYTALFANSKITDTQRYSKEAEQASGKPAGSVMTVAFELDGQKFVAINGGPHFKFSEAVSFVINCRTQEEIDHFWDGLSDGGDPAAQMCGWLKDRFGVSWQVVPAELGALLSKNGGAAMQALMQMKKLDLATLRAAAGA
ncbi:VOC family protein [Lysobacter helvus]|uniref:VOC family protein n=2 Tax=Lysobacteraceae TaxID=32033 RepID=A0ABM7Q183_9GAMM|nr:MULTISPECIES: VOC family protein [Lysobacter]BCT90979.1 VOC family protein [Lysobacter caseinilyticus]BCT94132.1 VOC family protein [Lysobacter helvus]